MDYDNEQTRLNYDDINKINITKYKYRMLKLNKNIINILYIINTS